MKRKILAWIGIVWGAAILAGGVAQFVNGDSRSGAYGAGRWFALLLGVLLLFAGVRALRRAT